MVIFTRKTLWMVLSLLAFQGAWLACVLGAARGTPSFGLAMVALVWGVHLVSSSARCQVIVLTCVATVFGLLWDTAMLRGGVVAYASPGPLPQWAPGWILALWILFATLLQETLHWLHGRWLLAALLGGVGGPLSYWSAVHLGAGDFPDLPQALGVLAIGWAIMTPVLTEFARGLAARPLHCGLQSTG
ncbi:DUF2878 domain-containing protein [Pelomonas sp. KK5]|uniref:DUF2878 domain-containing protein n=1 Tax=Pelomonas sp. KK5 TaxID=1855730 RepID=UPI00097C7E44|nr:DUF2878 domain-containing protein [Pelomonas sp. KK5]